MNRNSCPLQATQRRIWLFLVLLLSLFVTDQVATSFILVAPIKARRGGCSCTQQQGFFPVSNAPLISNSHTCRRDPRQKRGRTRRRPGSILALWSSSTPIPSSSSSPVSSSSVVSNPFINKKSKNNSTLTQQQQNQQQRRGSPIHLKVRELFQTAKQLEQRGQWEQAKDLYTDILQLDSTDSHTYLALARLLARYESRDAARQQFQLGVTQCPQSIHLWQAWALHEANGGGGIGADAGIASNNNNHHRGGGSTDGGPDRVRARQLFQRALSLDPTNPYVCHAYGWMEQHDNPKLAQELWERALMYHSTAALVCSLANLLIGQGQYQAARNVYEQHISKITVPKEQTEVYLAIAYLEERYFMDYEKANDWVDQCLKLFPDNSMAQVAKARLSGRTTKALSGKDPSRTWSTLTATASSSAVIRNNLAAACLSNTAQDGRVYNAWANLHVKQGQWREAKQILQKGTTEYPKDFSLLQAFGTVEGKLGNITGAKLLYEASLAIQPSAPCLVSLALLELQQEDESSEQHQQQQTTTTNSFRTDRFEQALTFDRRHGPAYNAYAKAMWRRTRNETATRIIYERGIHANCTDSASIFHGYAKFELQLGDYEKAREILLAGTERFRFQHTGRDSPHRDRAAFLFHTLGMLELNCNHPKEALLAFQNGMEYCGKSSQMLLGAALCYIKLGNDEEARTGLERSVRRDPCHAQAWHAWAVFEMRSGNIETAKTLLECGVRKVPNYGSLWEALAVMKGRMGQTQEARILFEKGIEVEPTRSSLYQNWASLESRQENYNAAKALITKALTMNKRSGEAWIVASEIERQLGNMGLSNLLLRRGIENVPTAPSLYRTLGENLVRDGKIQEAREIFEQGIKVDALYAPLYHSLAELEARLFNVEGLAALHKRTKDLFNTNLLDRTQPNPWEQHQTRKKNSFKVPRSVLVLAETIVGKEPDGDGNKYPERGDRDIVGSLEMNDEFLKNIIYGSSGNSEDLL